MKKIIGTIVLSCLAIGCVVFYGYNMCNQYQTLRYELLKDDTYAVDKVGISGEEATEIVIPSTYQGKKVTAINQNAFYGHDIVKSITIPDSIISIGESAFSGCENLTSVTIPNSVTSIGESAFSACASLASITIPNSVTSIGESMFSGCASLTSIEIPDSVTSIGRFAFSGCENLTSITIPASVTSIGTLAFNNCENLENVYLTDLVAWCNIQFSNSVETNPLWHAKNLYLNGELVTELVIPDGVTTIGACVFANCEMFTSITIPDSVIAIEGDEFLECARVIFYCEATGKPSEWTEDWNFWEGKRSPVVWDCSNNDVADDGYAYTALNGVRYKLNGNVAMVAKQPCNASVVNIPEVITYKEKEYRVTSIDEYAFGESRTLTSITIPDSITSIGEGAFAACDSLTSVTIPNSVTSIGEYAFEGCDNLANVTIPDSVTSIGRFAFVDCDNLTYNIKDNVKYLGNEQNPYTCLVGVTDTSIKNVKVEDDCKVIACGAFSNCDSLTSMTLPFVGESRNGTNTQLSYIFGEEEYNYYRSYIPDSLKTVVLTSATSIGKRAFYDCENLESITICEGVSSIGEKAFDSCRGLTGITLPESLTSIGNYAFNSCDGLTSVNIPKGVTHIGDKVFAYSDNLTSITVAEENTAYASQDGIVYNKAKTEIVCVPEKITGAIVIPNGVSTIEKSAFSNRKGLTSITIPNSVTTIGDSAFWGCNNLENVYYSGKQSDWNDISIGEFNTGLSHATKHYDNTSKGLFYTLLENDTYAVSNGFCTDTDVVIPSSYNGKVVTAIGNHAFSWCAITSITIPDSITSIGEGAFNGCRKLASITIPKGVTAIPYQAFAACDSLMSVVIPNGVTSIGRSAFEGCDNLENVTIPDSVTSIGAYVFDSCNNLTYNVKDNVKYLGNAQKPYLYLADVADTTITSVAIDSSCKFIGSRAFYDCNNLTSVTIPDGVLSISDQAFYYCAGLTSVTIPDSVTSITEWAFLGCSNLTSVAIGENSQLTYIGQFVFAYCEKLTSVVIPKSITLVEVGLFKDCSGLTSVYYGGTANDWADTIIAVENAPLASATIYYYVKNEADVPTDDGNYWRYVNGVPTAWV